MVRQKNIIDKKVKKKIDGRCCLCGESNYSLLDVHRILEGSNGGRYTEANTITGCCSCHRRIHAGEIQIDRKYYSTAGKWILHCWIQGEEKWLEI